MSIVAHRPNPKSVLITCDAIGGVWTYTVDLVRFLRQCGIAAHVVVLGPAPDLLQKRGMEESGAETVECLPLPLDWTAEDPDALNASAEALADRAVELGVNIAHLSAPALAGLYAWPMPLVVSAHSCLGTWWAALGEGPVPADFVWRIERTAHGLSIADAVIAPSESFARDLASIYGTRRIIRIHNGCSPAYRSNGKPDEPVIFTSGRLWDRAKNTTVVDDAAALIDRPIHAAGSAVAPNGETVRLHSLVQLGLLNRNAMEEWYRRATIFVSTSKYEPFGLAVLEAAQFGAALVLSDIPTFRELWDDAAVFVDPDDAGELAAVLIALADDTSRQRELAVAAGQRAIQYSASRMGAETLAVYQQLLARSASARASREATA